MLKEVTQEKIFTYTAVYSERESEHSNAQIIADTLGAEHDNVLVKHEDVIPIARKVAYIFDDLVGNPNTLVPVFLLTEKAREKVKSIFTADGSDMLFYGEPVPPEDVKIIRRMSKVPVKIRRPSLSILRCLNLFLKMYIPHAHRARIAVYLGGLIKRYNSLLEASLVEGENRIFESILKGEESNYFDIEDLPYLLGRNSEDPAKSLQNEIQAYF
jgi:asparagine synthetase B (glutamine-hydrolysing)